jgi:hypothetical protein
MKILELLSTKPIVEELITRKMPGKLAYALVKNISKINAEFEIYEKARVKLLADNWPFNPEANRYDIPDPDKPKWEEMHRDLLDQETNLNPVMVDPELFDKVEEIKPAEIMAISWMIKDDLTPAEVVNGAKPASKRSRRMAHVKK